MTDKNKKSLSQSILSAQDLKREPITIPEWNFEGFVQELDGDAAFAIAHIAAAGAKDPTHNVHILEAYVCAGLVDKKGDKVFTMDQRSEVAKKNPEIIERVSERVQVLSGHTREEVEKLAKK